MKGEIVVKEDPETGKPVVWAYVSGMLMRVDWEIAGRPAIYARFSASGCSRCHNSVPANIPDDIVEFARRAELDRIARAEFFENFLLLAAVGAFRKTLFEAFREEFDHHAYIERVPLEAQREFAHRLFEVFVNATKRPPSRAAVA